MGSYPALLITKLTMPKGRPSQVARPQLVAALDGGVGKKLILVAAAAGFGKTTLAAGWSGQFVGQLAWLSLDRGDNDPVRFLSYVTAAVQQPYPEFGRELLAALQSPQPPSLENALYTLVNLLAALEGRLILVLDDYHVIKETAVHNSLTFLLEHLPSQKTLVLLSRSDPPLSLARLRARNELVELRAADLRFSEAETADFLNETMALDLPIQAMQALEKRTEGWIAGLQLAAVALQSLPDGREGFIDAFTGSHRFVLDYLMEEVLSNQTPEVRDFLVKSSFLQRLCAPLGDAVMRQTGQTQGMLDYLEKHNLFLVPLDHTRTWFRYHHLFGDLLQARLLDEAGDNILQLRRRAAEWHAANHLPEEAVQYALEAEAYGYAVELITGPAATVFQRGEVNTLLSWFKALPDAYIDNNPHLCLQFGLAFALNGRWPEAERLLGQVEASEAADSDMTGLVVLSYLVASHRQDTAALQGIVEKAALNPDSDPLTKTIVALIHHVLSDNDTASSLLDKAQKEAEQQEDWTAAFNALLHHGRIKIYMGHLHEAHHLCQLALERARQLDTGTVSQISLAYSVLGRIYLEWDEPDVAVSHLNRAIEASEKSGFRTGMLSSSMIMMAEAYQAQGKLGEMQKAVEEALRYAARHDPPAEVEWLKSYQARLWLNEGNLSAAAEWLEQLEKMQQERPLPVSIFYPSHIRSVTQARVLLAQQNTAEAIDVLSALLRERPTLLTAEAYALLALAAQANGDHDMSRLALTSALLRAEAEGQIRLFFNLGRPMFTLLDSFCRERPHDHPGLDFAISLLKLKRFLNNSERSHVQDPLSDREREILRLITAGYSNQEIADRLFLALSTVKWYINAMYAKLEVKSRSQAIAKAHELGLFPLR